MLQETFERAASAVGCESVFLVGNVRHETMYREQLPDLKRDNLILEPTAGGTAAAVALASIVCSDLAPGATVATIPADHLIPNSGAWTRAVRAGFAFAGENDCIVCLGTTPRTRETKFGYLVVGDTVVDDPRNPIKVVERFIEKPNDDTLDRMLSEGRCVRNMGTLMFRPPVMIKEMRRLIPDVINPISEAYKKPGGALARAYGEIPVRSVDEAVLQRSMDTVVVLAEITNIDAGDLVTLGDAIGRDERGNAVVGNVVAVDARDNTVFAENVTVALVGVSDIVVVVEGDKVLICAADETQRIKKIPENS